MAGLDVDVSCKINKAALYVQFALRVHGTELSELNAYDRFLKSRIEMEFAPLIKKYGMGYATDSAYLVHRDNGDYLVLCLMGEDGPSLRNAVSDFGIEIRDIVWR